MTEENIPYYKRLALIRMGLAEKTTGPKPKKPLAKKSAKKIAEEKAEKASRGGEETELQKWYKKIMDEEPGKCWETGERIDKSDTFGWHGSIAHVLPKNDYPSVATHPQNYMILKMWGGTHGQYDSSFENASKMKIWPYAVKIINILYPLLTQEEKRKLPEVVLQEINPEKYLQ